MAFRGFKAFRKSFVDFTEDIPRGAQAAIRREASNWFGEIVSLTPVDTGFASSKWDYTINTRPPSGSIKHPGGSHYSPAATPTFYRLQADDTLYVYNNVAYIKALNDGWSSQAPKNFFDNSARRANRRLQRDFDKL